MKALVLCVALSCAHAPSRPSPQADDHIAAGAAALASGDLERAEAEYHLALEYAPALPEGENGLGLVAMARGDARAARGHFGAALRANPDFAEAHSNLGALDMQEERLDPAIEHFRAALAIDPGYPAARFNLARALDRAGRREEALAQYLELTSTAREDAAAWAELAAVNLALGRKAEAAEAVATALRLDPAQPTARRVNANLLRDARRLDQALAEYDALVREHPDDVLALVDRGIGLVMAGRPNEALEGLRRAQTLAPRNATVHFALGVALVESGDDPGAVAELGRAVELTAAGGRDYPEARYLQAGALGRLGRRGDAIAAYEAFLARARGDRRLADLVAKADAELAALRTAP